MRYRGIVPSFPPAELPTMPDESQFGRGAVIGWIYQHAKPAERQILEVVARALVERQQHIEIPPTVLQDHDLMDEQCSRVLLAVARELMRKM